jgi:hypothetical protein
MNEAAACAPDDDDAGSTAAAAAAEEGSWLLLLLLKLLGCASDLQGQWQQVAGRYIKQSMRAIDQSQVEKT